MKQSLSVLCLFLVCLSPSLTAQEESFRVTLLGTGYPTPNANRFGPATLVEAGEFRLLFDAGRGASIRLNQLSVPLGDLDGVFITHFHNDHISGLGDLWMTGWQPTSFGNRKNPLPVWGPKGISTITNGLLATYALDIDIRVASEGLDRNAASFDVHPFTEMGIIFQQEGLTVTAFAVEHGEHIKPAVGYRVDYGDRSVLISGDTRFDESVIEAAAGVDVLIHEVAYINPELLRTNPATSRVFSNHTTPEQAGYIFNAVQPRMAVYTHVAILGIRENATVLEKIIEDTRINYQGPLVVGQDLMRIEIGEEVMISE